MDFSFNTRLGRVESRQAQAVRSMRNSAARAPSEIEEELLMLGPQKGRRTQRRRAKKTDETQFLRDQYFAVRSAFT